MAASWKGGLLWVLICAQILCIAFAAHVDVWPFPSQVTAGNGVAGVDSKNFAFNLEKNPSNADDAALLKRAIARYQKLTFPATPTKSNIAYRNNIFADRINGSNPTLADSFLGVELKYTLNALKISLNNLSHAPLSLEMDESYDLHVPEPSPSSSSSTFEATLTANSIWGLLRGLETFSQLVSYRYFEEDQTSKFAVSYPVQISDVPRFKWRGLMLDTARHYLPVADLKRSLDAMSFNKLNVLHWHLSDAESFPFQSQTYPKLSKQGAYAPHAIYTAQDIKDLIAYAKDRGIRVVMEIDTPGHTASWGQGHPEVITDCYEYLKSVNKGRLAWPAFNKVPLDVTKNVTYDLVSNLLKEIMDIVEDEYFHIGGDEVAGSCWNAVDSITKWARENGFATLNPTTGEYDYDWIGLQSKWMGFVQKEVSSYGKRSIVWDDVFEAKMSLSDDTIVHVWQSPDDVPDAVAANKQVLNSWGWYLDRQAPTCKGSTCPVAWMWMWTWRQMYTVEPLDFFTTPPTAEQEKLILGGEAASWHESVDENNLDQRVFSRLPAVSERLWSPRSVSDPDEAQPRLASFQCKMGRRGIKAAPTEPSYCEYLPSSQDTSKSSSSWTATTTAFLVTSCVLLALNVVTCVLYRRRGSQLNGAMYMSDPLINGRA